VYNTDVHGGTQMAVLAYAAAHYREWRAEPGLEAMGPGGFGENLTIDGLDEHSVCIGDTYDVGEVRLQVSQPRGPCSNISRRWGVPTLLQRVAETGRTGWYLRVLREGLLERGQEVSLAARPHPDWSVARLLALRLDPQRDPAALAWLAACEELSPQWRAMYAEHAARLA
jgi:MOSC domain-containing protein YiiM